MGMNMTVGFFMRSKRKSRNLAALLCAVCLGSIVSARAENQPGSDKAPAAGKERTPDSSPFARIEGGLHLVDGKPFLKTDAWWGANHWMTEKASKSLGFQLALPEDQVGGEGDFYGRAGYTTTYFSMIRTDTQGCLDLLRECLKRARKTGQKVVIHSWTDPSEETRHRLGWTYVNEDGETKPLLHNFHYDAEKHAAAMRESLAPLMEAIRDEPDVIGYQIGGETWAAISYDPQSIGRFRDFLKGKFSLEELSLRHGRDKAFYKSWDEVFPPIKGGAMNFKKRPLPNGRAAQYDWACYNRKVHLDSWVAMLKVYNELDGRGRPISFEWGHGPYANSAYGLYGWDFPAICDRSQNFTVGPGEFAYSLAESMQGLYAKVAGTGPRFVNELGAGSGIVPWAGRPAYMRRHIWWTLAMGFDGFHVWTLYNLLGANSEFIAGRNYDPILRENLPAVYFEAKHCNDMIGSLGELLASSTGTAPDIGLLYLEDSNMAGYVSSYKTDSTAWFRALGAHGLADRLGIPTEYHLDHGRLDNYKAIILPLTPRITEARARKLADYVSRGGTLVLQGASARVDDNFNESATFPAGPLAEVAGVHATLLPDAELKRPQLAAAWQGRDIFFDVRTRLVPAGAQTLLVRNGEVLATVNTFGKGRCIMLAGKPLVPDDDDPTGAFLVSLLHDAGIRPAALLEENGSPDTGVYAGHREGPHGKLLILIENADRAHSLKVTLDPAAMGLVPGSAYQVFECFSDETAVVSKANGWTFQTSLEPVGVRVYLVTTDKTLDAALPRDRRLLTSRDDPDQELADRKPTSKIQSWHDKETYTVSDILAGQKLKTRMETVTAADAQAGRPRDLGDGFFALNLDGYCNAPLRSMLKDIDYSTKNLFGAGAGTSDAKESLPLIPGRNAVGEGPFWVNGRYVEMGPRLLEGIPVGRKVSQFSFFHHGLLPWLHESTLGYYRVNYTDGTSVRIPIALFTNLSNLAGQGGVAPRNSVVWQSKTTPNRLLRYDWVNPKPEKEVESLDVIRNDTGKISVWAVTAKTN
jgi:hypothetical protein